MTVPSDRGTRPQLAEVSSPALPTRSMEIIRTPGVAREQEYAEREMYTGNVLTLDTRLLQDIVTLLHCGCPSLNPCIEFRIRNNSSSSDVLYIQASISISLKYESK